MKVPLLDLKAQYRSIKAEVLDAANDIFEQQQFILGAPVKVLEKEIAAYCGTAEAVGVSSGSDALLISLWAIGIQPGDSVLTTPYTFFATAGAISRLGARPIFADIDPFTYNLCPIAVERLIDKMSKRERAKLKAIIPVHLYGQCADMDPILQLARDLDLAVVEDAAQAIGAEYKGRRAGNMGDYGCFSFFPSKNLGAFGDGGMVVTRFSSKAPALRILRQHGSDPKYHHHVIGGNFRLDAFQAAIVRVKLKYLDQWCAARQENAACYRKLIEDQGLAQIITPPLEKENRHIYNQFVIRVSHGRDDLRNYLLKADISTEIYYPIPLHLQKCFNQLNYAAGDFPVAEKAAQSTLALPIYPELNDDQKTYIIEKIKAFYKAT